MPGFTGAVITPNNGNISDNSNEVPQYSGALALDQNYIYI